LPEAAASATIALANVDRAERGWAMIETRKRRFLKGAGALALTSVLPLGQRAAAKTRADVVVIGAGTAGMPTAIFAAERGLRVIVIEHAPVLGGTLDRSSGQIAASQTIWQRKKGIEDSPDRHYADNLRINRGTADPVLTRAFVDLAPATLGWLAANGYEVLPNHPVLGGAHENFSTPRYQWSRDAGKGILAVMEPLYRQAEAKGQVTTRFSTAAIDLLQQSDGAVRGVLVEDENGGREEIFARQVVLASGGCAANPRLFEDLHGVPLSIQIAYPYNRGAGLLLGQSAGGYLRGGELYNPLFGAVPEDDTLPSPAAGHWAHDPATRAPWEIYVNSRGERFVAEDHASVDHREKMLARQPGHRCWAVFDAAMVEAAPPPFRSWSPEKYRAALADHPMFARGETLDELAVKAGIDPAGLAQSVAAYNRALAAGATDPLGKQHRPRAIAQAPFHAVRLQGWTVCSFAGLTVDGQLRVIRRDGSAVPNLYALGEVIGAGATSGNAWTNGMMVTPALAFGRLLGGKILGGATTGGRT
jgi:fumarate reductase flavoprotein subunit